MTPWAPDPWLLKVYATRPAPTLTTAPASLPLPPPRDLGEDARELRREALARMPSLLRDIRGAAGDLRGLAAAGRALTAEMLWTRAVRRAGAFGGLIHAVVSSGRPTSQHDVLEAGGCRLPSSGGVVPVWREHDPDQVIGQARILTDGEQVYAEIALADDDAGRQAARDCLEGRLWGASAGYAVQASERRFFGLGERISEWTLSEVSLTAAPRDWRCRAVSTTSRLYHSVIRAMGFPTKEERRWR